jgi:hypothetical protein
LAKRYLHEAGSDEFDDFLGQMTSASISRLTVVELCCLPRRRRRNHEINASIEQKAGAAFEEDIAQGFFEVHPLEDQHAIRARELLISLAVVPLSITQPVPPILFPSDFDPCHVVLRRISQPRQNHKLLKSLNLFTGQTLREQPVPQFDIIYPSKALINRSDVADFDLLRNRGHDRVMRLQLVRCDQA